MANKSKTEKYTHPFSDLSRYGIEQPFLSDAEVAELVSLRSTPTWMVLAKVRTHLVTIYGRRAFSQAKTANPESFKNANIAEGVEISGLVLEHLTRGEPVPDIYSPAPVGGKQRDSVFDDDL